MATSTPHAMLIAATLALTLASQAVAREERPALELTMDEHSSVMAFDGDTILARQGGYALQVDGDTLVRVDCHNGLCRFEPRGNGVSRIISASGRHTVLAVDWPFRVSERRGVEHPLQEIELQLTALREQPEPFLNRLFLFTAETEQAPEISMAPTPEAHFMTGLDGHSIWVEDVNETMKPDDADRHLLLVEVVEGTRGPYLRAHRRIPTLSGSPLEPTVVRENGQFRIVPAKADPIVLAVGDLLSLTLRQTRSSRTWYEIEGDCLSVAVDMSPRFSSQEWPLLRGASPGECALVTHYKHWQDEVTRTTRHPIQINE